MRRPATMAEARAQIQAKSVQIARATLAQQWQEHADATLSVLASHADVMRSKREFYGAELDRLAAMQSRSTHDEALFREALTFGKSIGRAA